MFTWMDKLIPGPNANSYKHWGTYMSGTPLAKPEPKNKEHQCAVANASEAWGGKTSKPWGWASQDCSAQHVYMCRISSGWRGWLLQPLPSAVRRYPAAPHQRSRQWLPGP
jgi:hypothetical protein